MVISYASVGDWRLTGVDEHVSVERALWAEHFAADRARIGRGGQRHEVVRPDVLGQVVVAWQQLLAHGTRERLLAVVTGNGQYLHISHGARVITARLQAVTYKVTTDRRRWCSMKREPTGR